MYLIHYIEEAAGNSDLRLHMPAILTLGNFDGVHLGHQAVLQLLVDTAKKEKKSSVVITFSNHPSEVLRPLSPTPLLCTLDHKLMLLEQAKVDCVLLLPFTAEFSQQSAEEFLQRIREKIPYQTLILGSDAHIGKNREGDQGKISSLAKDMGFSVHYFPDRLLEGQRISSSRVREAIEKGLLKEAEKLLGRPYSVCGPVLKGSGRGAPLGFPTANISVDKLCLPPQGVYTVTLLVDGEAHRGIANLGNAPTLNQDRMALLEVHLFDKALDLYSKLVDVQFHAYIRPEQRFETPDALKAQIAQDIAAAKITFGVR